MAKPQGFRFIFLRSAGALSLLTFASVAAGAPHASAPQEVIKKITRAPASVDTASEELHIEPAPSGIAIAKPAIETQSAPATPVASPLATPAAAPDHATAPVSVSLPGAAPAAPTHELAKREAVMPAVSLRWLTNGNTRFTTKRFRADGRSPADRQRLLAGQTPHAIVLSCSDSRVAPELVFDQALGEIVTIRVAGEALDSSVIASIETALEQFGVKLLIVMGHTKCDAIEAALQNKESANSEALDKLLADIRPRLRSVTSEKPSPNLEVEATVNADGIARDLVKRSEIIRRRVESGDLVIKPALYRLDSGKVNFY